MTDVVGDATEAIHVKATVLSVPTHDITDFKDGLFVLIHLSILKLSVKGALVFDLQITQREIDSNGNVHLPALTEVLKQTRSHVHLELIKADWASNLALFVSEFKYTTSLHLNVSRRRSQGAIFFLGTVIGIVEDCDFKRKRLVVIAEFCHG